MSAFVTSDLHMGHEKSLTFLMPNGERLRPFSSIEEMHETIIERWNKKVHRRDTVYCLGDIAFSNTALRMMEQLNGRKILVAGNHDRLNAKLYLQYFADVRGAYFRDGLIFTHIPVHPDNLQGNYIGNVHGHLHCHKVMINGEEDKRFFNACLEPNNFSPVPLEHIKQHFGL